MQLEAGQAAVRRAPEAWRREQAALTPQNRAVFPSGYPGVCLWFFFNCSDCLQQAGHGFNHPRCGNDGT